MHQWTDLAESFLKMYSFAMLRSAGQKLYEIFLWCSLFRGVHYTYTYQQVAELGSFPLQQPADNEATATEVRSLLRTLTRIKGRRASLAVTAVRFSCF